MIIVSVDSDRDLAGFGDAGLGLHTAHTGGQNILGLLANIVSDIWPCFKSDKCQLHTQHEWPCGGGTTQQIYQKLQE